MFIKSRKSASKKRVPCLSVTCRRQGIGFLVYFKYYSSSQSNRGINYVNNVLRCLSVSHRGQARCLALRRLSVVLVVNNFDRLQKEMVSRYVLSISVRHFFCRASYDPYLRDAVASSRIVERQTIKIITRKRSDRQASVRTLLGRTLRTGDSGSALSAKHGQLN